MSVLRVPAALAYAHVAAARAPRAHQKHPLDASRAFSPASADLDLGRWGDRVRGKLAPQPTTPGASETRNQVFAVPAASGGPDGPAGGQHAENSRCARWRARMGPTLHGEERTPDPERCRRVTLRRRAARLRRTRRARQTCWARRVEALSRRLCTPGCSLTQGGSLMRACRLSKHTVWPAAERSARSARRCCCGQRVIAPLAAPLA
jgi:hypothetical protein